MIGKHGSFGEIKDPMGVTEKKVERSGISSRARTMAGAGPTDLSHGSRGLPATYDHPGRWGPHKPCPSGRRVTISDTIRESFLEAREEKRHSERRMGTDMEDIVTLCEGACGKRCHLRVPAEASDEEVMSCRLGSKARRYRKRSSPKLSKKDGESAMEMTPGPVCWMFSALSDTEGDHTCYPSDGAGAERDFPAGRSHTAENPELAHDAELPRRLATTRVPRHAECGMMGPEAGRMNDHGTGETVMGRGVEWRAREGPPRDSWDRDGDGRHQHEEAREVASGDWAREDHCHCRHAKMPLFKGSISWRTPPVEFLRTRPSSTMI